MVGRRGFLGSILALGVAPAVVKAESLMRVVSRPAGAEWNGWAWVDMQTGKWYANPNIRREVARPYYIAERWGGGLIVRDAHLITNSGRLVRL